MADGKKFSWLSAEFAPGGENWGMSCDPNIIIANFSNPRWLGICGIGVPTGVVNDIVVIDIDTLAGHSVDGLASLRQLEAQFGPLPDTLTSESPTGSLAIYFRPPTGIRISNSTSLIAPGIDVRGEGGMVIAPPSFRPDKGFYRWKNEAPIADAPAWLIELLTPKPIEEPSCQSFPSVAPERIQAALNVVPATCSRTEWLAVLCGLYKELGQAGLAVADAWSATGGSKYKGRRDVEAQLRSIAAAGGYGWTIGTLFWLASKHDPNWEGKMKRRWKADDLENNIQDGERISAIDWMARTLLGRRINPTLTLILLDSYNQARCKPPLDEDELTQIFDYRFKNRRTT